MRPVRVLLLWPGTVGAAAGNFGVPQLVTLATWLRHRTGAAVTVVDLVAEAALQGGTVDVPRVLGGGCQVPVAAMASVSGGRLALRGMVAGLDGREVLVT